ncbi:hypothetical protein EUGRSUZ_J00837 [Eucalyptus grandis]|uniref:Uncharacterized protein n=2 Tax=Eucalyptus grandis TaxID=71139 RepID=A0ACC3J3C6_EUCGR|nr:hypothetical protein EUGRSUZ_J00837 [Eucalyptus grandis]
MARERLMGRARYRGSAAVDYGPKLGGGGSFGISGSGQGRGGHFAWLLTWDEEINVGLLCPAPNGALSSFGSERTEMPSTRTDVD